MKTLIIYFFKKYQKAQLLMIIGSIFVVSLGLFSQYMLKFLVDDILTRKNVSELIIWGSLYFSILTINTFLSYFYYTKLIRKFTLKITFELREIFLKNILNFSYEKFLKIDTTSYLNRIIEDASHLGEFVNIFSYLVFSNSLRLIITLGFLIYISPVLTLIFLMIIPFYYLTVHKSRKTLQVVSRDERLASDAFFDKTKQTLASFKIINVFNKQSFFLDNYAKTSKNFFEKKFNQTLKESLFSYIADFITSLAPFLIIICGSFLVFKNKITIGELLSFYMIMSALYVPLDEILRFISKFNTIKPIFERDLDLLNTTFTSNQATELSSNSSLIGSNLSYKFGDRHLFSNINFNLQKGEFVGIRGANGAGKTTLMNLIAGLNPPTEGKIIFDGSISIAEQEPMLLTESICDNISLGIPSEKLNSRYHDLFKVAEIANEKDIRKSESFSGGERQRICLTRAFSHSSNLVLLDEPSSYLDSYFTKQLYLAIDEARTEGKIIICISHDSDLLNRCSKIVQL